VGSCSYKKPQAMSACCEPEALASFASFASDESFVMKHDNPIDFQYLTDVGKAVTFKGSDGVKASGFFFKAKKKSNKFLFVFQEWWGLNDHIKKEAEKYFNDLQDVNVLALDMYDGKIATNRDDAATYMQAMKYERGKAIVEGALKFAGKKAKIATVGWCFGGGWSLQSSLIASQQAKACVMYYGLPEKDKEKLKALNAEVLGIFASKEQWISPEIVSQFEATMKEINKPITIKNYDAEHAFANPSNPNFNKTYADEAYSMSLNFIKEKLK
jgi:carboxymethylenebutenolidase